MRQRRLASLVVIVLPWALYAQSANVRPVEIKGHFIGESIAELLSKEPEAQQKVNVCEQHPGNPTCDRLLAAVKSGQRAEVSTSSWMNFVLDGGKLVKLTTLVNEGSDAKADLTKKFGPRSSETAFPMQNALGASWEDHLSVWETPAVYVTLREDNNPASQNHHFVLVVESRAEHAREHADAPKQPGGRM
jgi:hypothetical protein